MQLRATLALVLMAVLFQTRLAAPLQLSAVEAANNFCQLDANGNRLNARGAKEAAKNVLLSEGPWNRPSEIVIVRDCSVRALTAPKSTAEFALDYTVLGRIDSSFALIRLHMPYTVQPIMQSERLSLVLTDTHYELATDGRLQPVKGGPEWRIKSYPASPHVSIAAALEYVRAASYRSKDMLVRTNAEKTLIGLQNLQMSGMGQAAGGPQPPQEILSQFIELELDGQGLTQETSRRLDAFFVHPDTRPPGKIGIARAYAIKRTSVSGNKATVHVEYGALGDLDPQLGFVSLGPRGSVVQQDYKLTLDNKYSSKAT